MKRLVFLAVLFLSGLFFLSPGKVWAKQHPYLFFEENDINVLKEKIGREPFKSAFNRLKDNGPWEDRLLGYSFSYLLSGTEADFQKAALILQTALEDPFRDPNSSAQAWDYGGWVRAYAIVYDWLYQKLSQNPELLNQLQTELRRWVDKIGGQVLYLNGEGVKAFNNAQLSAYGGIGLALLSLENEVSINQDWLGKVKNKVKSEGFALAGPEGQYQEGFHYQGFGLPKILTFAIAYQRAKSEDLISNSSMEKIVNWFLYSRTSSNWLLSYADGEYERGGENRPPRLLAGEYLYLIAKNNDSVGKWFWNEVHSGGWQNKPPFYAEFYYPSIILWYPDSLPSKTPQEQGLAQSRFFSDHLIAQANNRRSGLVILRNGFGTDNLVLSFFNRFTYQSHQHYDPLSFTLSAYGEELIIDAAPHGYGSEDRGVDHEHNLVVIDLRDWSTINSNTVATGMAFYGRHSSQLGFIDHFFTDPSFDFTKGDARYPYADISKDKNGKKTDEYKQVLPEQINPIVKAQRSIMFVKNPAHPYFIIADDFQKDQSNHSYSWLLHTRYQNISGEGKIGNPLTINTGTQSLLVYFLSPPDFSKNVVNYLGDHRVIEVKKTNTLNPYFISLLYPKKPSLPRPEISQQDGQLVVGEITWPDSKDYYLFNKKSGTISVNGQWVTDGGSAYLRLLNSQVSEYFGHNLTFLAKEGADLIRVNNSQKADVFYNGSEIKITGENFTGGRFFAPGAKKALVNQRPVDFSQAGDYLLIDSESCFLGSLGDLDCNGLIDFSDLTFLILQWGKDREGNKADLNKDKEVDYLDLTILINNWTVSY